MEPLLATQDMWCAEFRPDVVKVIACGLLRPFLFVLLVSRHLGLFGLYVEVIYSIGLVLSFKKW
jgi:hypothetical protein